MKLPTPDELSILNLLSELKDPVSIQRIQGLFNLSEDSYLDYPQRLVDGLALGETLDGKLFITDTGTTLWGMYELLSSGFNISDRDISSLVKAYPLTTLYSLRSLLSDRLFRSISQTPLVAESEFTTLGASFCEAVIRFNYGKPDLLDVSANKRERAKALASAFGQLVGQPDNNDGDDEEDPPTETILTI